MAYLLVFLIGSAFFELYKCNVTKRGLAMNIDEYVPTTTPIIKASVKYLTDSPPKRNTAKRERRTVNEVFIERIMVS